MPGAFSFVQMFLHWSDKYFYENCPPHFSLYHSSSYCTRLIYSFLLVFGVESVKYNTMRKISHNEIYNFWTIYACSFFLYPLKTWENLWFPVFRGREKKTTGIKWINEVASKHLPLEKYWLTTFSLVTLSLCVYLN